MAYYQGDIMHCQNLKCSSKEICYRYWLGERAKYHPGIVTMYTLDDKVDKCEYYLNIKDYG